MSFDTTAKPRPASPARAASTEPLTASMLVCTAIKAMTSTIFSMRRPTVSERMIVARLVRVSASAASTPSTNRPTAVRLSLSAASIRETRSLESWVVFCASLPLFSIWTSAAEVSWVADACCCEPRSIC